MRAGDMAEGGAKRDDVEASRGRREARLRMMIVVVNMSGADVDEGDVGQVRRVAGRLGLVWTALSHAVLPWSCGPPVQGLFHRACYPQSPSPTGSR